MGGGGWDHWDWERDRDEETPKHGGVICCGRHVSWREWRCKVCDTLVDHAKIKDGRVVARQCWSSSQCGGTWIEAPFPPGNYSSNVCLSCAEDRRVLDIVSDWTLKEKRDAFAILESLSGKIPNKFLNQYRGIMGIEARESAEIKEMKKKAYEKDLAEATAKIKKKHGITQGV